jgi:malate dehydrogenase
MGTSAWYAPGSSAAQMVESILRNQNRIFPCCVRLNGEYGVKGAFVGVPVKLGAAGIEQIIEIDLNATERADFNNSVKAVTDVMAVMDKMNLA